MTLAQYDENAEFTICQVVIYEEVNVVGNSLDPLTITVGGPDPDATLNEDILLRKHPIYTNVIGTLLDMVVQITGGSTPAMVEVELG